MSKRLVKVRRLSQSPLISPKLTPNVSHSVSPNVSPNVSSRLSPLPSSKISSKVDEILFYLGPSAMGEVNDQENGQNKSKLIRFINQQQTSQPLELINSTTTPNHEKFMQYLDIYENNQQYYRDDIAKLHELENWFSNIREPYIADGNWRERELTRKETGISAYCDPEIRKWLLKYR